MYMYNATVMTLYNDILLIQQDLVYDIVQLQFHASPIGSANYGPLPSLA